MSMLEDKIKTFNILKGSVKSFNDLLGYIVYKIDKFDDELILYITEENYVRLYHDQDCCESVYIEDICGDLDDLIGSPLLMAEEVDGEIPIAEDFESCTWTFYKFATQKGFVTIRWCGSSNGYYSERVDIDVVFPEDQKSS